MTQSIFTSQSFEKFHQSLPNKALREKESMKYLYELFRKIGLQSDGKSGFYYGNVAIVGYSVCKSRYLKAEKQKAISAEGKEQTIKSKAT